MATTTTAAAGPVGTDAADAPAAHRRLGGRWIEHWDPEDGEFWRSCGRSVARRNLGLSVFTEFLGFAVWAVWSVVVPQLDGAGFTLTVDQKFWLVSVPALVGATLRLPYTFAVARFGGRNWTIASALLLLVPSGALALAVSRPQTGFATLLLVAALAGLGGGNFASSMANISFFYPEKHKGRALGINAAGGNVGTAAVQLAVPALVVAGAGVHLERAGLAFVPLVLLAAGLAWRYMDNLASARADRRSYAVATRHPHTWVVALLYVGTFGSFIGYSGAFPMLLTTQFPDVHLAVAFTGALVGSLARPLGGLLADRWGGARVTMASYVVMGGAALAAVQALGQHAFGGFLASFLVLFVASGMGNGSVYRMIPAIFRATSAAGHAAQLAARRAAAGCLGIAGAVGAFGGFLIPRGFALSTARTGSLGPALVVFVGVYAAMLVLTWAVYRRRGAALAAAGV